MNYIDNLGCHRVRRFFTRRAVLNHACRHYDRDDQLKNIRDDAAKRELTEAEYQTALNLMTSNFQKFDITEDA